MINCRSTQIKSVQELKVMPPRWPRKPDRQDPAYRRLDDRMNFAIHVAAFAAGNSGLWFFHNLQKADWPWLTWVTLGWGGVLFAHAVYVFAIANYSLSTEKPE